MNTIVLLLLALLTIAISSILFGLIRFFRRVLPRRWQDADYVPLLSILEPMPDEQAATALQRLWRHPGPIKADKLPPGELGRLLCIKRPRCVERFGKSDFREAAALEGGPVRGNWLV